MRLLRLVDDDVFAVEFHPYITVVTGLDDGQREAIVAAFDRAAVGRTSGMRGLMEVHGVVLDLDDRSLALLELGNDDVETCVHPSDLPGRVSGGVDRQVRSAERRLESLEQPHRDRVEALSAAEGDLERALATERAAGEVLSALGPATPERESATPDRDPDAGRALDEAVLALEAAQEALARSEDEVLATAVGEAGRSEVHESATDSDDEAPGADVEDRIADLRAALALHRLEDPDPVRDALDEVRLGHNTGGMVQSPEALSLADRIETTDREIARLDEIAAPTSTDLERAAQDVERVRASLAEAQRREADSDTTAEVEALEDAHREVEAARDALGGRLGRARAQRRLDDAAAAENEVLDRLGLTSYTEFLTLGGAAARPEGGAEEVELARRAVEQAEAESDALEGKVDAALAHAELVATRRTLVDEARELLGEDRLADDRVAAALIEHRVPASTSVQIEVLVDLLGRVGLPVQGLGFTDDEVEAMAAEWLAERQHAEARILRKIEELESQSAVGAGPVNDEVPVAPDRTEQARRDVAAAESEMRAAKDRVMAHERSAARLSALDEQRAGAARAVEIAAADVSKARAAVTDAAAAVDAGQVGYGAAVEELAVLRQTMSDLDDVPPPVEEVEWYLLARLAGQRQQSFVGSLPLVVVGALDGVDDDDGLVHLLDRLERMAGAVQIVHLTDDARVAAWADALPDERAAVVRPVAVRSD